MKKNKKHLRNDQTIAIVILLFILGIMIMSVISAHIH